MASITMKIEYPPSIYKLLLPTVLPGTTLPNLSFSGSRFVFSMYETAHADFVTFMSQFAVNDHQLAGSDLVP